jgi:hypothetical protein
MQSTAPALGVSARRQGNRRTAAAVAFDSLAQQAAAQQSVPAQSMSASRTAPAAIHVSILGTGELQRIRQHATPFAPSESERAERERLHALSKERASQWTNTLQGARLLKLKARQERLEREERERQQLDLEEEQLQAQRRKEAIEEAKLKMFFQSARTREFHGALAQAEVLRERAAQVAFRQAQQQRQQQRAAEEAQAVSQAAWEEVLQDERLYEDARLRRRELDESLRHQMTARHAGEHQLRQVGASERAHLEQDAAKFAHEQEEIDRQRREKEREAREVMLRTEAFRRAVVEQELEQDALDDLKRHQYREHKRQLEKLRADRHKAGVVQRTQVQEHIFGKVSAIEAARMAKEAEFLSKNAQQKADREAEIARAEADKRAALKRMNKTQFEAYTEKRRQEAERKRAEDAHVAAGYAHDQQLYIEEMRRDAQNARDKALQQQHTQMMQTQARRDMELAERERELQGLAAAEAKQAEEDAVLLNYERSVIQAVSAHGQPVYPLSVVHGRHFGAATAAGNSRMAAVGASGRASSRSAMLTSTGLGAMTGANRTLVTTTATSSRVGYGSGVGY